VAGRASNDPGRIHQRFLHHPYADPVEGPHAPPSSELGRSVAEALIGADHEAPDPVLEGLLRARPGDEQADPADVLLAMIGRPAWHAQAACRGVPTNLFFPRRGERTDEARHLCATCPVTADCLAEALAIAERDDDGFRAGMSAQKRRRLRRSTAA